MDANNWKRVKELFDSAVGRAPGERSAFLAQVCGTDESLRKEVESLLACDQDAVARVGGSDREDAISGRQIGDYQVLHRIGQGGMAAVYLGVRADDQYRKRVAIKLIPPGLDTEELLRRFRNERQTLAALEHANIVRLLDGGTSEDGLPFLVMDYVEGMPIDQYCDTHRLSTEERLRLFVTVCGAVHYAHQNLVIHRDLKPSNVLVTAEGIPKLLDFGIAKVLKPEFSATLIVTQTGLRHLTPAYASPEQIRGEPLTNATDIYSLGVLLYELLTGHRPYRLKTHTPMEIERAVCEEEPVKPSTVVTQAMEETSADGTTSLTAPEQLSRKRDSDPKKLRSRLHGDLDAIVMMALRKEPQRRYGSVYEFAEDIGRHLEHEPVRARPASQGYRLQKYVRRHRFGVAAVASLVVLLVSFAIAQTAQLRRITRERDRANRITDFMTNMFKVSDPSEARGNSITAREILDKASKDIDIGLAKDPELQAQMMNVMGKVYDKLGLYARAESLLTRAVEIRRRVLGPQNRDTLTSMNDLGGVLEEQGNYAEAERLVSETLETSQHVLGPENAITLMSMNALGWILYKEGRYVEAEKLYRQTLDLRRRVLGPEHPDTLASMQNLNAPLMMEGRYVEAEKLCRQTLDLRRRVLGPEHPDTLVSMHCLGVTLAWQGNYPEADKFYREALEIERRVFGPEHPRTLYTMSTLASDLAHEGRYDEAEKRQREVGDIARRVLGPEHPVTALSANSLAVDLALAGKHDEALSLLREAVDHGLPPYADLWIEKDPDLKSLHGDPRFDALVAHAKERAAAAQRKQ